MRRFRKAVFFLVTFVIGGLLPLSWPSLGGIAYAFHFPWDQGHDTTQPEEPDDDQDPGDDDCNDSGCPFQVSTGNFFHKTADLLIPTAGDDITIFRTYNSRDMRSGPMGHGWSFSYDFRLIEVTDGGERFALLHLPDGKRERFLRQEDGSFASPEDFDVTLVKNSDDSFTLTDFRFRKMEFDAAGRLTGIVDPNGFAINLDYGVSGTLETITGPRGRSVSFTIGANGKIATITDPDGRVLQYQHDADGNLTSFTDTAGSVTSYEYDSNHNLQFVRDGLENVIQRVSYDSEGRVASFTEQGGQEVWTVSYTPASRQTTKSDSRGETWTFIYNENGNVTTRIDPLGNREEFDYDDSFNLVGFTDKNGNAQTMTYDGSRRLAGTGSGEQFTYAAGSNQPSSYVDARGNATQYGYDANGNVVSILDALGNSTQLGYDAVGRLVAWTDPLGNTSTFGYDANGNRSASTSPLGNINSVTFSASGNLLASTDSLGRATSFTYDAGFVLGFQDNDRVSSVRDPLGGDTDFSYDAAGNLTQVTDPIGNSRVLEHDSFGRVTRLQNAAGQAWTFEYDVKGNVVTSTDPKGQTTIFTYDDLGRLASKQVPGNTYTFQYDAEGNLIRTEDDDSVLLFSYNADGQVSNAQTLSKGVLPDTTISYSYDANGNRTSMTDPQGGTTNYQYDALDRVVGLSNPNGQVVSLSYDAVSRRTGIAIVGGRDAAYSYDGEDRLLSVVNSVGSSETSRFEYQYDAVGNRVSLQDQDGLHQYLYDQLDRLVSATHPTGSNPAEGYAYDRVGNRSSSQLSSAYTYDAANRLIEDDEFTYEYDANGNLTKKTGKSSGQETSFDYDAEDQLTQVTLSDGRVVTFRYDGLGRRIEKSVDGQIIRYVHDGEDLLLELDAAGAVIARYTHAPQDVEGPFVAGGGSDQPLVMERGGQNFFYHTDGLGSVAQLTDEVGNVVNSYAYDTYGRVVEATEGVLNPFAFAAREFDPETGLYFYRTRYYEPNLGRFLSEDLVALGLVRARAGLVPSHAPVQSEAQDELNLYAYVGNNPVNFLDPNGFGGTERGKLPGTNIDFRIDWKEQPHPDMHVRWPDGKETNINHNGGWNRGKHKGQNLVKPPKKYRKPLRKVVKRFVKKAAKLIPVVGVAFWLLDAQDAYALTQDPCSGVGDYVNMVVPYKDIGSLFK